MYYVKLHCYIQVTIIKYGEYVLCKISLLYTSYNYEIRNDYRYEYFFVYYCSLFLCRKKIMIEIYINEKL